MSSYSFFDTTVGSTATLSDDALRDLEIEVDGGWNAITELMAVATKDPRVYLRLFILTDTSSMPQQYYSMLVQRRLKV